MFKYRLLSGRKLAGINCVRVYGKWLLHYGSIFILVLLLFLWLRTERLSRLKDLGDSRADELNRALKRLPVVDESRDSWRSPRVKGARILSAYLDTRPEVVLGEDSSLIREDTAWAMIRIIGIVPVKMENSPLTCHYRYRYRDNEEIRVLSKRAIGTRLAAFQENFGMTYCAAFLLCELPGREDIGDIKLPYEVTVSTSSDVDPELIDDRDYVVVRYPINGWKNHSRKSAKNSEKNDINSSDKNDIKNSENSDIKNFEKSDIKNYEKNYIQNSEKNDIKNSEKNSEKNDIKNSEKNGIKNSEKNDIKNSEKNGIKNSEKNSEKNDIKNSEKNSEKNDIKNFEKNSEKNDTKNSEKNSEKNDIKNSEKNSIAVCVQPLHHKFDKALDILAFVEYYRMMGVGRFTFYRDTVDPRIDEILDYYTRMKLAIVVEWRISEFYVYERNLRVDGIFAALNDCLYRSSFHQSYRYVAGVDIDEYIVPRMHDDIVTMMDYLNDRPSAESLTGAWIFRNMFFYLMHPDDTRPLGAGLPKLKVHTKTTRWREINRPGDRSKFIVQGRDVIDMGNHHIWKLKRAWSLFGTREYKEVAVDPEIAGSHHYRKCETTVETCYQRPTVLDRAAHRFTPRLAERVANVSKTIFPFDSLWP